MTWLQTASGRAFDLLRPDWRDVDFEVDIPEALARIARFTGHVRSGPYSVAQHCVIGADAIWRDTRSREAAAAFLLHDAHEAYLGDIATPIAQALARWVDEPQPGSDSRARIMCNPAIDEHLKALKARIDREIYRAAFMGLDGCPAEHREIVKMYDVRLLVTECADLLGPAPRPWGPPYDTAEPLRRTGRITVQPWHVAADEYRDRLRKYLPQRFGAVATAPLPKPKPAPCHAPRRIPEEA